MLHRVRQLRDVGRKPSPADYALARAELDDGALWALFEQQHPRDVVHAAATARWLTERGHRDSDLLQAALLHDVGKGQQRSIDRVTFVVLSGVGVAAVAAAAGSRFELRRACARAVNHSEAGAVLLASAGASPRLVNLTRAHHEAPANDPVLALLQLADAAN